jgi:hypothetical protein
MASVHPFGPMNCYHRAMRILALAAVLLSCACAAFTGSLTVRNETSSYSPAMSSTVGIGFTPVFEPPFGTTLAYHWSADFGEFVSWGAPDYKVAALGPEADSGAGTLYWTYDPRQTAPRKSTVTIRIEARDVNSGRVLANKTITLDWDRDTARIRE